MACKNASPYVQTMPTWSFIKGHLAQMTGRRESRQTCGCPDFSLLLLYNPSLLQSRPDVNCCLPQGENEQRRCASCAGTLEWCCSHRPLKLTLTIICPSHCQLSQITLFHSFVTCVTCHGNKCVCMGSEDDTINSFALGPAFCCQHIECDPWETAAASWPPESLLAQWGWHPLVFTLRD